MEMAEDVEGVGMKRLNNKDGSTIVSVMVAFVILLMAVAMFYTSVTFATQLINRAVDVRQNTEKAMEIFYTDQGATAENSKYITLVPTGTTSGGSIVMPAKLGTYDTGIHQLAYFVAREGGLGYKRAKNILEDIFSDGTEYEKKYGNGYNSYTGNNYNEYIKSKNDGEYPPALITELKSAEKVLEEYFKEAVAMPDNLTWHANNTSERKQSGYYLIASNVDQPWEANMIYIDGHLYVATKTETKNGVKTNSHENTAQFYKYTKQELIDALSGKETGKTELDVMKLSEKFLKVS